MPLYEFECVNCGKVIEMLLKSGELDKLEESCPECGGDLHKIFSTTACNTKDDKEKPPSCFTSG
jgi:putative FmdB family regulatory protein